MDTKAQQLITQLAISQPNEEGYNLQDGLIRYQGRIWIGANTSLQTKIIQAFLTTPVGGHSGMQATFQQLKKLFHWKGLKQDVQTFVQQCAICQQAKHKECKLPGLLHPLPIPDNAWQDISMDFIEGLPKSNGYNVILVVVDRLTKYAHFIPLRHPFTANIVAKAFLQNIVKLHGVPRSIVSDRDKIFTSLFWKELFKLWDTKLQMSTAYHP